MVFMMGELSPQGGRFAGTAGSRLRNGAGRTVPGARNYKNTMTVQGRLISRKNG
jgi:hypothetical protein